MPWSYSPTDVDVVDVYQEVPAQNSADNVYARDVIGNKTDTTAGNSIVGLAKAIKAKTDTIPTSPLGTANIAVTAQNSTDNVDICDVIGNKTDDETGNSLYALLYILSRHAHSEQKVYPTLAAGINPTAGAGAWTLGSFTVVVPTSTITSPFDIHGVHIGNFSANDTYELVLYRGADGAEVEVGRVRFTRLSNTNPGSVIYMTTPLIAANSQIKCKLASSSGSNNATFSILYHTY